MREVIIGESDREVQAKVAKFRPLDMNPADYAETRMIGTPEEIIDQIRELERVGMTYFVVYFQDAIDLASVEIFGKSVMKKLKG